MSNPITAPILEWAATYPEKPAVVLESVGRPSDTWTYAQLAHAMETRSAHVSGADGMSDPSELLFHPDAAFRDQVLLGLARLHAGHPIVGSTSGTTGQAKRYCRSQASWIASFEMDRQVYGITAQDVIVAPGALTHSLFSYALCHGLYCGATVVLSERYRPDQVLAQLPQWKASVLYGVPTQLKIMAQTALHDTSQAGSSGARAFPSVRWVLSSGARWFADTTPMLAACFPGAKIAEFYGASELSFVSTALRVGSDPAPAGSVGKPMPGVCVQVDADRLWVNSPGLFDGYLSDPPPDFHERVDRDGRRWISIGDLGRMDEQGYLYLSGREARKVIVSGKNLYPEEVEQALSSYPGVEQVAVVGQPDPLRGERLVAVVMARREFQPALAIAHLRGMLEDYKVPRRFFLAQDWPLTASGKTDIRAIQSGLDRGHYRAL